MIQTELMRRINKFDNMLDNSVNQFNQLFNCRLPYNLDDTVEILEPFTCGGRYIKVGDNEPQRHMFRKDFTGYQRGNWKAIYQEKKLLGIFKTFEDFEEVAEKKLSRFAANRLFSHHYKSKKYLVLELFE